MHGSGGDREGLVFEPDMSGTLENEIALDGSMSKGFISQQVGIVCKMSCSG